MIRLPPSRGSAAMPVRSPYPDVEIPDVSLTAFLFGDFGDRVDAPAFIDGPSGRAITFGELAGMVDKIAGGAERARHRSGRRRRALCPQLAGVGRGLPRRAARQRRRDQRELALHPERAGPPARRLRRQAAHHRLRVPRPGPSRRSPRPGCPRTPSSRWTPSPASRRSPISSPRRPRHPRSRRRPPTPRCCRTRRAPPGGPRASCSRTATSSRTSRQIAAIDRRRRPRRRCWPCCRSSTSTA